MSTKVGEFLDDDHLKTIIATSGQISAHSLHPLHLSGSVMMAGVYPRRLIFSFKAISLPGHAMVHNPQPLHLLSSISILGIAKNP
jgi:hypothetical protein